MLIFYSFLDIINVQVQHRPRYHSSRKTEWHNTSQQRNGHGSQSRGRHAMLSGNRGCAMPSRRSAATEEKEKAVAELKKTVKLLDQLAAKGVIHQNTAANQKSRLTKYVNRLNSKLEVEPRKFCACSNSLRLANMMSPDSPILPFFILASSSSSKTRRSKRSASSGRCSMNAGRPCCLRILSLMRIDLSQRHRHDAGCFGPGSTAAHLSRDSYGATVPFSPPAAAGSETQPILV